MSLFSSYWDIDGLVAVITGAGGAIGRELAVTLRRDFKCHLALCDNDEVRLNETLACVNFVDPHETLVNLRTTTHVVDVSNRDAVIAFAEDVRNTHGRCEIVFNNAGVGSSMIFDKADLQLIDKLMNINLGGVVNVAHAFLPLIKQSTRGALINTSSLFGFHGYIGSVPYCMAKFGITALTQCLAIESGLFFSNVHIASVHPGFIKTQITRNSKEFMLPIGRTIAPEKIDQWFQWIGSTTPKECAERMVEGMRRGDHRIVIGTDARIMDLITRLFPNLIYHPRLFLILMGLVVFSVRMIGRKAIAAGLAYIAIFRPEYMRRVGEFVKRKAEILLGA